MISKFIFSILILIVAQNVSAQYDSTFVEQVPKYDPRIDQKERTYWLDAGVGLVGHEMGYQFSFNYQVNKRLMISAAYDRADYFFGKPDIWNVSNSISIDGGFIMKGKALLGYLTFGPSYSWGKKKKKENADEVYGFNNTNLKFKVGCVMRKFPLGLSTFFHFNPEHAYAGITLNYAVGKNLK